MLSNVLLKCEQQGRKDNNIYLTLLFNFQLHVIYECVHLKL